MTEDRANTFLRMIRRSRRGRLKIYLGYGAGVGKTYQMLQEGHRLMGEGIAVVVGLIETHGRVDTAKLIDGLEVIPRRSQEYRGHILEEMDVDAVLNRRPEVALVDELAHTNVPGGRNPKRYQDVQDILTGGDTRYYDPERSAFGESVRYRRKDRSRQSPGTPAGYDPR